MHYPSLIAGSFSPTWPLTSEYPGLWLLPLMLFFSMIILSPMVWKIPYTWCEYICLFNLDVFLELWVCISSCLFHTLFGYQWTFKIKISQIEYLTSQPPSPSSLFHLRANHTPSLLWPETWVILNFSLMPLIQPTRKTCWVYHQKSPRIWPLFTT